MRVSVLSEAPRDDFRHEAALTGDQGPEDSGARPFEGLARRDRCV
jgi:hypothetical protein